jgi:hypothetical protein
VPFTSESKVAIADYDEIRKEMKLALMECGRKLGTYLRKRQKMRREGERRDVFERYIGEIAKAINAITGDDPKAIYEALLKQAKSRTAVADQVLDEDGKVVKEDLAETDDEGVLIIPDAIAPAVAAATSTPLAPLDLDGKAKAASKRGAKKAAEPKAAAAPKRAAKPAPESAARAELRARAAKAAGRGKAGGEDGARLF